MTAEPLAEAPRAGRRLPRLPRLARAALAGAFGAVLAVSLFAQLTVPVAALRANLAVGFGTVGRTEIRVPPFGEVWARTHSGPLVLRLTLVSLSPDDIARIVSTGDPDAELRAARAALARAALRLLAWTALLAVAGGFAAALLARAVLAETPGARPLRRRRAGLREGLVGGACGLALIGSLGGWTYATFDARAFAAPHYEGALRAAPWLLGLVEDGAVRVRELGQDLSRLAAGAYRTLGQAGAIQGWQPAPGDVAVLLVSDIHLNPVGLDLVQRVAASFHPAFVLDAGDLDDYGTALEGSFLTRIGEIPATYVLVPGNHDSPAELDELRSLPNVRVLTSGELVVAGVPVVGEADPSSARAAPAVASREELLAQAEALRDDVATATVPPAIAVAHDPDVGRQLLGLVPVVVSGHTHRVAIEETRGSLYLNPGTTGAAGIRGLIADPSPPYSMMVLYLARGADGRLAPTAVDTIEVAHDTGSVHLERRLLRPTAGAPPSERAASEDAGSP
ncbi:MAG: metallophosphoesterase family protein [Clostridia bacterium]|nr:metallophosphoesterase family protein [Clostridia bacterium]